MTKLLINYRNLAYFLHQRVNVSKMLTVLRYKFTGKKERYEYKDLLSW